MFSDSSEIVKVRMEIPSLQTEVMLDLNIYETVWNLKNNVIRTIASDLRDPINYGFYVPSSAMKAAKYLDEDRTLREYNLQQESSLQFINKKRIYKASALNTKILKEINKMVSHKKFLGYIQQGFPRKVKELLDKGLDPNFLDPDLGECPLTLSVSSKLCSQMITYLVGAGAHLDYRNKNGWTAIHKAARNGHMEALKNLLDFGSSPNYRDLEGKTPLYIAVCNDTPPECIKQLMRNYAILGITDDEGDSEIHQICKHGKVQHLDLLITYGADMNSINLSGNTPLHICAMKNQEECARLLLFRGANKEIKNCLNQKPNELAIFYKYDNLKSIIESHRIQDVVVSNELPSYNEKSRLTLKRSERNSLLLSKMNKLSLSTPYLHQSVINLSLENSSKFTNDCNSVRSSTSENHSTGSADQQFEFDADVTVINESRPSSLPSNMSHGMTKRLNDISIKSQNNNPSSLDISKKSIFLKKLFSDFLSQLDNDFHKAPLRRQSSGDVLHAQVEDIYMNDREVKNRLIGEKWNSKLFTDDLRLNKSYDVSETYKPSNVFKKPIMSSNIFSKDVYINLSETPEHSKKYNPSSCVSTSIGDDENTASKSLSPPGSFIKSSEYQETMHMAVENHKFLCNTKRKKNIKYFNKDRVAEESKFCSSIKRTTFDFIPTPPVFQSSSKNVNSLIVKKKLNSPPFPPPPLEYNFNSSTNYPLLPVPIQNQINFSSIIDAKAELVAAFFGSHKSSKVLHRLL